MPTLPSSSIFPPVVSGGGGGGVTDGDKGDIVVSGGGTIWTLDPSPYRISADFVGQNTRGLLNALKVTAGRFAGAYRERYAGNIKWYFAFAAMTLAPEAFTRAERQACCAAAIDRGVVAPRQSSVAYPQYTFVQFPSGKIFFCNIAGTSAGSAPSDAGATVAGDFLGDGTITWEYTGRQAPAGWEWFLIDINTNLLTPEWPDSHDAYAGMLAAAAEAAEVDAAWLATASAHPGYDRMEVIDQLIQTCMTDQLNGSSPGARLTYTFQDGVDETGAAHTFRFLADNVEVWRGYRAQIALRAKAGLSTTAATTNAADVKTGVLALFSGGRFQTYEGQSPAHLALTGDADFVTDFRFHLWPMLHGMLETLTEVQTYADAVMIYTVAEVPGLFTDALNVAGNVFPMGEWYAAAADGLGVIEAQDCLAWRVTSRLVANVVIVDAALALRQPDEETADYGKGTATIDFGAAPGSSTASVAITGQTGITGTAAIRAWIQGVTADFNEYEHSLILPQVVSLGVSDVVAGTGFTIQAATQERLTGDIAVKWEWA